MVAGAFSYEGNCELQRVDGKMSSEKMNYPRMLYGDQIPFELHLGGPKFQFQHVNSPNRASKSTKNRKK